MDAGASSWRSLLNGRLLFNKTLLQPRRMRRVLTGSTRSRRYRGEVLERLPALLISMQSKDKASANEKDYKTSAEALKVCCTVMLGLVVVLITFVMLVTVMVVTLVMTGLSLLK